MQIKGTSFNHAALLVPDLDKAIVPAARLVFTQNHHKHFLAKARAKLTSARAKAMAACYF